MDRFQYAQDLFIKQDLVLTEIRESVLELKIPDMAVNPLYGQLLNLLVKTSNAKRVLEIGTLGGFSAVCMARGMMAGGRITCLELNPKLVELARLNIAKAGLDEQIEVLGGDALSSLDKLAVMGERFDFFFIDADKKNYIAYLEWALRLGKPGALIVADNVLLKDRVVDADYSSPSVEVVRQFNQQIADHPRLDSVMLPLYDGLIIARIREE